VAQSIANGDDQPFVFLYRRKGYFILIIVTKVNQQGIIMPGIGRQYVLHGALFVDSLRRAFQETMATLEME
jgi:hypothetical protein